jgi:hypothetical protein
MPLESWVQHSRHDMFLYDWQTLIAGVLAIVAAVGTIWATIRSANREIAASQAQIAATRRLEQQRVARETFAFSAMLEAAMGRVIAEAGEAREIFSKAPHDGQTGGSPSFDEAFDRFADRTSDAALHAREHFTKSAFSELRSACLRHGGFLTAEFLELESLIDKFASVTTNREMLNLQEQPILVRVGYHEGLEDELAVIEATARHLREGAAKGMSMASAVMVEMADTGGDQ